VGSSNMKVLNLGAIGLGRAFASMAPSLRSHPAIRLVAVADPNSSSLRNANRIFGARTYADAKALLDDPEVDAVYIATPHELHATQAIAAFERGKDVLLEKPMALTLDDSLRIVEAGERHGRVLVVGHSHGFDPPVMTAARLISSGTLGQVRMISTLDYTNWMYRPRRPEELSGAGVTLNQASHQVDIVRLLGGGQARSVRASCGAWDANRRMTGAYAALLTFANGAFASLTYNGYDYFDSDEFMGWISETGRPKPSNTHSAMRRALEHSASEMAAHTQAGFGAENVSVREDKVGENGQTHQHFGIVIASCDDGDLRASPYGISLYDRRGRHDFTVQGGRGGASRASVFDELYDAAVNGIRPVHDGRWALANLEVCLAIPKCCHSESEVTLSHQIAPTLVPLTLAQLEARSPAKPDLAPVPAQ
jgi:phthalate 4,5-cis-dihydrodiol dehydrogenase